MKKFGLHGKLSATTGNGDQLAQILLEASNLMTGNYGCHLYLVSKDKKDPDTIWITEVWNTREDHDRSLQIEGVKALISRAMPLLSGRPEPGLELEVLGGSGI
jgi:quinol monooxygenase YgiN